MGKIRLFYYGYCGKLWAWKEQLLALFQRGILDTERELDGKTINQWISQDVGSDGVSHYSTFVKNINVDGTNGIIAIPVIVMGGKNYYTAIFPKDNYMFEILITSEFSKTPQETISLLDQIISTFKFTK